MTGTMSATPDGQIRIQPTKVKAAHLPVKGIMKLFGLDMAKLQGRVEHIIFGQLREVIASMRTHMEFMLPDGGWDNSWGTRNYKWTWWGSRTSDGCQPAYPGLSRVSVLHQIRCGRHPADHDLPGAFPDSQLIGLWA